MRRATVLAGIATLVVALSACGSTAAKAKLVEFGISGGNLRPYHVTIQPNGSVRAHGTTVMHRQISPATVRKLQKDIAAAKLETRKCAGVLPDVGSQFVRSGGRTVTVHGNCEPAFERVWTELVAAVGG